MKSTDDRETNTPVATEFIIIIATIASAMSGLQRRSSRTNLIEELIVLISFGGVPAVEDDRWRDATVDGVFKVVHEQKRDHVRQKRLCPPIHGKRKEGINMHMIRRTGEEEKEP